MADRQWLNRALANLLQNSLDALGDGPGEIRLSGDRGRRPEQSSRSRTAAEGFRRISSRICFRRTFPPPPPAAGSGLALVHQVVTRCQGTVEAENGCRGLRIRIELPLA